MVASKDLFQKLPKDLANPFAILSSLMWPYFFRFGCLYSRCKCGNCNVALLQNISECYCCCELEGCEESIKSDLVLQDLAPDVNLTCITEHPGFQPVCLQKWSLRLAADKFKTKGKERYRQTGSEESFLRSVAYREFSRLVYGLLGKKRVPLPACAYTAIRKAFPVSKEDEFTGFDLDDEN